MPRTLLISLPGNSLVRELDTNTHLTELARVTALPLVMDTDLRLGGECGEARLRILLPPGYREEDRIGYPAILHL